MLSLSTAAFAFAPTTIRTPAAQRVAASPTMDMMTFIDEFSPDATPSKPWTSSEISDKAGLEELANKLNPIFGYFGALRARARIARACDAARKRFSTAAAHARHS